MWYSTFVIVGFLSSTTVASIADVNPLPHRLVPRVTTLISPTGPQQTGTIGSCNKWYNVVTGDSCDIVEKAFGITHAQFIAWNPSVSSDCTQNFWGGYTYCVGVSSTTVKSTSTTVKSTSTQRMTSTATQTGPTKPTLSGLACNCNKFYNVVSTDTCPTVETKFGITHAQFLKWNPAVSDDCITNFWADTAYCVGISNLACPTTTSTPPVAAPPTTWTKTPNTEPYTTIGNETSAEQVDRPTATAWPPSPLQTGSFADCIRYHYVNPGETCQYVVNRYANLITMEDFLKWNPAVGADCTGLYVNYYYCVDVIDTYSLPNATSQYMPTWTLETLPTVDPIFAPEPTAPGADPQCQSWYLAGEGDTCDSIALELGYLGVAQIQQWNTGIACNAIVADTYYCVADYDKSSLPMPSTVTNAPQPTQGGIISTCKAWYLSTPGDTCELITQIFGTFSISDFLGWNPALGGITCPGLQSENFYCVGVPGTPTTRTTVPPSTPAPSNGVGPQPQQPGTAGDCFAFWLVSRGDNCTTLALANSITEDQIEAWNPAVGDGCTSLLPDYYVCVGSKQAVPPPAASTSVRPTSTLSPTSAAVSSTRASSTRVSSTVVSSTRVSSTTVSSSRATSTRVSSTAVSSTRDSSTTASSTRVSSMAVSSTRVSSTSKGVSASATTSVAVIATPKPTQAGMTKSCRRFYFVQSGDGCWAISDAAGISLDDFYSWNPAVKTDCSLLLAEVYVCIGISGPVATITSGPPFGPTPVPTQTGMVSGCVRFYYVPDGIYCADIASRAGITLSNFYSWNPAVGTSCDELESDYYVCIGTSGVPGTTITTGVPRPAKTA